MDIKSFLITIEKSFIAKGSPSETARERTLKIARSFGESDRQLIHAITSGSEAIALSEEYIRREMLSENNAPDDNAAQKIEGAPADVDEDIKIKSKSATKVIKKVAKTEPETEEDLSSTYKVDAVIPQKTVKVELTEQGKVNYKNWMMSKGIGYTALAVLIGITAFAVYALIAVLIGALVALLVGVAVAGCIATLAGLIYGIIKLFSVTPEGIYEIGLALVIFSITLAASIGLYNLAIRIVPMLWKRLTIFLKEKLEQYRAFLNDVRTECNER